jgi:BolA protein
MTVSDTMRRKLTDAFAPIHLAITDDSDKHAGHSGARAHQGGESHFTVEITSPAFAGKSRLERQRLVYAVLADELKERVHALALRTLAPDESRNA